MKKDITTNQLGIIIFILFCCNKLLILPSLIYNDLQINSIVTISFLILIDVFIIVFALNFIKNNNKTTFIQVTTKKLGKFFSKILLIVLTLFFVFKFLFLFNETFTFLKELVYENYTFTLFLIVFCLVCYILNSNNLNSLARVCEFCFAFVGICFVIIIFSSFFSNTTTLSYPYEIFSKNIANSLFKFVFFFSDGLFVFMFAGKVKNEPQKFKKIYIYLAFAVLFLIVFNFIYFLNYPITASLHNNALVDVTRFVPLVSDLTSIDIIPIVAIIFLSFLQGSLYLFAITSHIQSVFNTKNNKIINIICTLFVFVCALFFVYNTKIATLLAFNVYNIVTICLIVLFLIIFMKKPKRRYIKNEK